MDWTLILIAIGAAHALMLSAYAGVAARKRSGHAWLAALFAILAIVVTCILITHRTEGAAESIALVIEGAAAFAVGPTLYATIRDAIDRPLSKRALASHFGACALLIAAFTLLVIMSPWPQVQWAVAPYEMIYTAASALAFAQGRRAGDRSARGFWWPLAALAVMAAVHVGQAVRFVAPAAGSDAVPLIGAIAATIILAAVLVAQAQRTTGPRYARSTLSRAELQRIYAALERALDGPPPLHRTLDLSLAQLAAAAGVPMHHASQAISEIGGASYYDLITGRRVADAQTRLLDPANAAVAVDALGMEAGFRSRSAFYAAFKAATGATPAEFRRRGGTIVSGTAG